MNRILLKIIIIVAFSFQFSTAQTSFFPKIGYSIIKNQWQKGNEFFQIVDTSLHYKINYGFGIEQKITNNFKLVYTMHFNNSLNLNVNSMGINPIKKIKYNTIYQNLTGYKKISENVSIGIGLEHLQLKNIKISSLTELNKKSDKKFNLYGFILSFNYEFNSIGLLLNYNHTRQLRKENDPFSLNESNSIEVCFYYKLKVLPRLNLKRKIKKSKN